MREYFRSAAFENLLNASWKHERLMELITLGFKPLQAYFGGYFKISFLQLVFLHKLMIRNASCRYLYHLYISQRAVKQMTLVGTWSEM